MQEKPDFHQKTAPHRLFPYPARRLRGAWDKLKPDMERIVCGYERGQFEPGKNPFCLGRGCPGTGLKKKS